MLGAHRFASCLGSTGSLSDGEVTHVEARLDRPNCRAYERACARPDTGPRRNPRPAGTWKGESESVVFGPGDHPHQGSGPRDDATRFTSKPFTMTIDKQDGRRFLG